MQTFTAREYLKIDVANSFGLDKKLWEERIDWFDQHEPMLLTLLDQAEEPAMFFSGIQAWHSVNNHEPIGYPISLDATASGLQILAVLTGDRLAAELCNVVDTGKRQDAYTAIYQRMLEVIGEAAKIERDDTKRAIMTSLYSSRRVPRDVFGEGMLLSVFYNTMRKSAPAAWDLNESFLEMWDKTVLRHEWVLPDNFHVVVPVMETVYETVHFQNKPYTVNYEVNQPVDQGRSLGANTVHSVDGMIVREMTRRCDYDPNQAQRILRWLFNHWEDETSTTPLTDPNSRMVQRLWALYQESGYLSARILDYLRPKNLRLVDRVEILHLLNSLPKKPFRVLSTHDCFRVLPQYANDLRYQYNLQLKLIADSKLLQFLLRQILGIPVVIEPYDPTLGQDILQSNYSLS